MGWLVLAGAHLLLGVATAFPVSLEVAADEQSQQFLTGLVGILLTVGAIVFLAGCLCCHRRNGFKEFHNSAVVASNSSILDHGHINPVANGEFTIFTPLSPSHFNNNVFLANQQVGGHSDTQCADVDLRSFLDISQVDFPRTKLKYIKEIGKGWFGRVVEGTAQGLNGVDEDAWTSVAVRILEPSASSSERAAFLHDINIYRCGPHSNVLQLMGRSLETVPMLILQELCTQDLKAYLRSNQATKEQLLNGELPLKWCCQLAEAVKHLHDHQLTHPDLAARNCQLAGADLTLKLGDYGLAAATYPEDYYRGSLAVPVRWCAPESLTHTATTVQAKTVTCEGNVWSLGVVLWEICECGAQPYAHLADDDDVIAQVLDSPNVRLGRPTFAVIYTDYLFQLMQVCWSTFESRPSIHQVCLMLNDLIQVYRNTQRDCARTTFPHDFDRRWETLKPNDVARVDNSPTLDRDHTSPNAEALHAKTMSPSMNNLHGSLDNLAQPPAMDSWLQDVATKTGDMSYVRGLSEAIQDLDNALALENVSSSGSSHQPSPAPETLTRAAAQETSAQVVSARETSAQRTSSESETEDENWRDKVETGAYSEKVRQKSKSVTDLMVLTHIDCSESDSDAATPTASLEVGARMRRRYGHGSEGNLLSVQETFEEELRRMQEERKDSLLFVPDRSSSAAAAATLINELSSPTADMQPQQHVYNVFNCVVSQTFSPVRALRIYDVPKLSEIIQNNDALMDYIIATYDTEPESAPATPTNCETMEEHVEFDVSDTQAQSRPFTSTPYGKGDEGIDYSLESWDNFLGDTFPKHAMEPQSLLFVDGDVDTVDDDDDEEESSSRTDGTYTLEEAAKPTRDSWFLHPQAGDARACDDEGVHAYVGVRIDDEVAAAIRNELLMKLPQAQMNAQHDLECDDVDDDADDDDDVEVTTHDELNIKYNVYNAPLSPIPEESSSEHDSHMRTTTAHHYWPRSDSTISEDCDWPEPYDPGPESFEFPDPPPTDDTAICSPLTHHRDVSLSPVRRQNTPSKDLCSNDTFSMPVAPPLGRCEHDEGGVHQCDSSVIGVENVVRGGAGDDQDVGSVDAHAVVAPSLVNISDYRCENDEDTKVAKDEESRGRHAEARALVAPPLDRSEYDRGGVNDDDHVRSDIAHAYAMVAPSLVNIGEYKCENDEDTEVAKDEESRGRHAEARVLVASPLDQSECDRGGVSVDDHVESDNAHALARVAASLVDINECKCESVVEDNEVSTKGEDGRGRHKEARALVAPLFDQSERDRGGVGDISEYKYENDEDTQVVKGEDSRGRHEGARALVAFSPDRSKCDRGGVAHTPDTRCQCQNSSEGDAVRVSAGANARNSHHATFVMSSNGDISNISDYVDAADVASASIAQVAPLDDDDHSTTGCAVGKTRSLIINVNETARQLVESTTSMVAPPVFEATSPCSPRLRKVLDELEKSHPSDAIHVLLQAPPPVLSSARAHSPPTTTTPSKPNAATTNFRTVTEHFLCDGMEHYCKMAATFSDTAPIAFADRNEFVRAVDSFIRKEVTRLAREKPRRSVATYQRPVTKTQKIAANTTAEYSKSNSCVTRLDDVAAAILDVDRQCEPAHDDALRKLNESRAQSELIEVIEREVRSVCANQDRGIETTRDAFDLDAAESLIALHKCVSCKMAASFENVRGPITFSDQRAFLTSVAHALNEVKRSLVRVADEAKRNGIDEQQLASVELPHAQEVPSGVNESGKVGGDTQVHAHNQREQSVEDAHDEMIGGDGVACAQLMHEQQQLVSVELPHAQELPSDVNESGMVGGDTEGHAHAQREQSVVDAHDEMIGDNGAACAQLIDEQQQQLASVELPHAQELLSGVNELGIVVGDSQERVHDQREDVVVLAHARDNASASVDVEQCASGSSVAHAHNQDEQFDDAHNEISGVESQTQAKSAPLEYAHAQWRVELPRVDETLQETMHRELRLTADGDQRSNGEQPLQTMVEAMRSVVQEADGSSQATPTIRDSFPAFMRKLIGDERYERLSVNVAARDGDDVNAEIDDQLERFHDSLTRSEIDAAEVVVCVETAQGRCATTMGDLLEGVEEVLTNDEQLLRAAATADEKEEMRAQPHMSVVPAISDSSQQPPANVDDNQPAQLFERATMGFAYLSKFIDSERNWSRIVDDPLALGHRADDASGEFGAFTDIRFVGPGAQQQQQQQQEQQQGIELSSSSLSDHLMVGVGQGEQEWESGSDTRSSSSGEFIWKEGEHEESVKALSAAPQDLTLTEPYASAQNDDAPRDASGGSDEEEDDDEEEGEGPEFVPSAWDMYALPGKSALRSPEKVVARGAHAQALKKSKGVWFKKQKYHCVYEYPREPDSPVINAYDLWQSIDTAASDWGMDYYPSTSQAGLNAMQNRIYIAPPNDDEDFFMSSTSQPFDCGSASEFFPGQTTNNGDQQWDVEPQQNVTPDSGVEDVLPGGVIDYVPPTTADSDVPSLKSLATALVKPTDLNQQKESLGGLRHARNKLKLDLPPSPSAFTSGRSFVVEVETARAASTERDATPTFTTFGKSRFHVQHVATPTDDAVSARSNVSFEALPHKLLAARKEQVVEAVRGEASLLDSADEDSGIESSTLERKKKRGGNNGGSSNGLISSA